MRRLLSRRTTIGGDMNTRCLSLFLLLTSACSEEPTGIGPARLAVEVLQLSRTDAEVELGLRVTNTGPVPVHLEGCPNVPSVVVESHAKTGWQDAGSVNLYCIAILSPRREILKPGGSIETRLGVVARGLVRIRVLYGLSFADSYAQAEFSRAIQLD
jgi:hypothetical protein